MDPSRTPRRPLAPSASGPRASARRAQLGPWWKGVLGAAALALAACGPSFQVVYEGNARFEHCYALEENPRVAMPDKAACWRQWSERYTYGQTRDRIHYATARYVALTQAPTTPTDEALMMAAPGETRATTITAPAPTSAFAPPPKVLDPAEQPSPAAEPVVLAVAPEANPPEPAPPTELPASSCTEACAASYRACSERCKADAREGSCRACAHGYRGCMRGCFK